MFSEEESEGHGQELGGANSQEEVREKRQSPVIRDVGNGIHKHSDDLRDDLLGAGGWGLGAGLVM